MTTTQTTAQRTAPDVGRRLVAGLIDAALLAALTTGLTLAPLLAGGLALPMVGVFAATIAYVIVPMAAFEATLGMHLVGLRIVGTSGRSADATDLLFRELIGRGLLGVAYFATMFFGLLGYLSGAMSLFQPDGFGLVLFLLSGLLVLFGTASHFSVLVSPDGRGLHDRIAKTIIVTREEKTAPVIDDEAAELVGGRTASRVYKIVFFEIALVASAAIVPYMLSRPRPTVADLEMRTKLKTSGAAFEAAPANKRKYYEYRRWLLKSGDEEGLSEAREKYRAALAEQERRREIAVKKSFSERPGDWDTMASLVRILENKGDLDGADATFAKYAATDGSASAKASYGIWLYDNGRTKKAIDTLEGARTDGADDASVNAYLGWAYEEAGEKARALEALRRSMEMDPSLDVRILDDVERLAAELEG